jgi:MoaA/NifB/PqqE/SkfB family radical SAM enzyme
MAGKSLIRDKVFMKKIEILEFHISYSCNNDCIFCGEYHRLEKFKSVGFIKSPVVKKNLEERMALGCNFVNFTGGEPTLHPDFPEIVKYAKKLGYRVYVGTNGTMGGNQEFLEKALPYLDELSLSIHGNTEKLHGSMTKGNNFKPVINILKCAKKINPRLKLFVNTVIVKKNAKKLINFLSYLKNFNIDNLLISNLAPEGRGLDDYDDLALSVNDWKNLIGQVGGLVDRCGFPVRFFGLPFCVLNDQTARSNDLFWLPRTTIEIELIRDNEIKLVAIDDYVPDRNRIKDKIACRSCSYDKLCEGMFKEMKKNEKKQG